MRIAIIIPVLNEARVIGRTLGRLQGLRQRGHRVVVVDGGSSDESVALATPLADSVLTGTRGRARQMNAGAEVAEADVLWFLHADTLVPAAPEALIGAALSQRAWGRFDVRLSGGHPLLRVVERLMNLRSCVTGIATGDQGIFVRREAFAAAGGYPDIPLMEDIALSRQLKKTAGKPECVREPLITSSRRWEEHGIVRTILLMWALRLAWFLGVSPARLARYYR